MTYHQLIEQANQLMVQANQIRKAEAKDVIKHIKTLVKEYDVTPREIFGAKYSGTKTKTVKAKYVGPNGEVWFRGSRGRRPSWVANLIESGDDIEKHRA